MKQFSILKFGAAALVLAGSGQLVFAAPGSLPPSQHAGEVTYLSGGVGSDQSAAIKDVMHQYPLVLEFAGKTNSGNDYLADIPVQVSDVHGKTLLNTSAQGPFMLLSLPHGRYSVTASYKGVPERRTVNVTSTTHARETFIWPM